MKYLLLPAAFVCLFSCDSPKQETTTTTTDTTTTRASAPDTNGAITTSAIKLALPLAYGIDISKYQGDEIDFIEKKQDTLTFVICKATEGVTSIDPDFRNNWTTITKKGFTRGAYHFYHCGDEPVAQARHFLSAVDSFSRTDFPPIVDFEEASIDKNCSFSQAESNLLKFLQEIERETGRIPIIYTDNNTGGKYLNNAAFQKYPLFIADYTNSGTPRLPGAWKNKGWALWQKSERYVIHSTTDDFDIFNGSIEELRKFISGN
jgi:lysozyme